MALHAARLPRLAYHTCRKCHFHTVIRSLGRQSLIVPPPAPCPRREFSRLSLRCRQQAKHEDIVSWSEIDAEAEAQGVTPKTEHLDQTVIPETATENGAAEADVTDAEAPTQSTTSDHVPWFLRPENQLELEQTPTNPLSARQQIPELPYNAPEILQPLMERVSIDLGMDDLRLLDLRSLDPRLHSEPICLC